MPHREENTNTVVAQVLRYLLRVEVKAESSGRADRRLLDIHIPDYGAVLEAKYDNFCEAVKAAAARWGNMKPSPEIVGAVSYHPDFRKNPAKAILCDAPVEFSLVDNRHADMHSRKRVGTVYDLAQSLRRPKAILNPGIDEVDEAVNRISGALGMFWGRIQSDKGTLKKMARILQANFEDYEEKEVLEQSARVGGLILFGAVLFQSSLAQVNARVSSPWNQTAAEMRQHWKFILEKINYAAILGIAERLLGEGAINSAATKILVKTAEDMKGIIGDGHDFLGNIYHRLLIDAKPLGAFYTSIPAATLMAGLALRPEDWGGDKQWADLGFIENFRIADPACGSGTLLAAACWQVRDNFSRADAKINGIKLNGGGNNGGHPLRKAQKILLENSIWGYDILETAGHLTATTLGLIAPDVDFSKAHIYRTIIGKTTSGIAAGSLEMLESSMPIFIRDKQVETSERAEPLPPLDLCIMNPPYVRGTTGNLAYSFLGEKERIAVKKRMNQLGKKHGFSNDKGPGAAFVALACQVRKGKSIVKKGRTVVEELPTVKEGGRLAVILPTTAAAGAGNAWSDMRCNIENSFDLETLIVSRDPERPHFSESTNLQECIIIARKRKAKQKPKDKALFVVLDKNPRDNEEALAAMQAIRAAQKSSRQVGDLRPHGGYSSLIDGKIGQFARLSYRGQSAWLGVSFSNLHLTFAADKFSRTGSLSPYASGKAQLVKLGDIAEFGGATIHLKIKHPDYYALDVAKHKTNYPAYYPSKHREITGKAHGDIGTIAENPHIYVLPAIGKEEKIDEFYEKAGRIVLAESFRFNTTRRLAALVSEPVQASHYWPITLHRESATKLKAMTLWLNSTPALLLIAHAAQSTHGAKVGFSQTAAKAMPVLDVDKLGATRLRKLAAAFDRIAQGPGLSPLPQMMHDEERKKIDDAVAEACGLGDLSSLRAALAVEPIITNKSASAVE